MNGMRGYEPRDAVCHRDTLLSRKAHFGYALGLCQALQSPALSEYRMGIFYMPPEGIVTSVCGFADGLFGKRMKNACRNFFQDQTHLSGGIDIHSDSEPSLG